MKTKCSTHFIKILFLAIGVLLFSCKKEDFSVDCAEYPKPKDFYSFPVLPGTPAWASLSPEQRLPACQIPDKILGTLSTAALVQSWIDFPLNYEISLGIRLQQGIDFFTENFSGLKELFKRNDAGLKLLERYQKMNPACIVSLQSEIEKGSYSLDFVFIEMIIAQDTILKTLESSQKKQLVSEALKKFNAKVRLSEFYGSLSAGTSLFVCIRTMKAANYTPFLAELQSEHATFLNHFIYSGNIPTNDLKAPEIKVILEHAERFIK